MDGSQTLRREHFLGVLERRLPFGDSKAGDRERLLQALEMHQGNRTRAAQEIGMPRRTFYRRLSEYGIGSGKVRDAKDE
jgi:transcriptional regulator of acetoin/glycerol metabolism